MTVERRAGAPRLIEWTGERCVPWTPQVPVAYEHYHRYLWAAPLVAGRRVLDLASGEGFGAAILAGSAAGVVGIEIDERTVEHSQLNYCAPNLEFKLGSALDLSEFDDDAFDAVVAFEMIEHVADQDRVLAEADRVLTGDGLLILSTPDRLIYSDAQQQDNPFHERELTEAELRRLLASRFGQVALWGQRIAVGSRISAIDELAADSAQAVFIERSEDSWRIGGEPAPVYLLAVASHTAIDPPPAESNLIDVGLEMIRAKDRELEAERAAHAATAEWGQAELQRQARAAEDSLREQLAPMQTLGWSLYTRVHTLVYGAIGTDSRLARILRSGLRAVLRLISRRPGNPG
jgi:SAM-dependent methyltransferase